MLEARPGPPIDELLEVHERDAAALLGPWGSPLPLDRQAFVDAEARSVERRRARLAGRWAPVVAWSLLRRPRGGRWPGPLSGEATAG